MDYRFLVVKGYKSATLMNLGVDSPVSNYPPNSESMTLYGTSKLGGYKEGYTERRIMFPVMFEQIYIKFLENVEKCDQRLKDC